MSNEAPHDDQAERVALGAMMLSARAVDDVTEHVAAADFYQPRHELIFDAILAVAAATKPDAALVGDELTRRDVLTRAGGPTYLHELISSVPTVANAGYYARIVADLAVKRRLATAGVRIAEMAGANSDAALDDLVNAARQEVDAVDQRRTGQVTMLADSIWDTVGTLDDDGDRTPTPWEDLDHLIGGLRPGALYVIGARPGVGKSVLGSMLALDVARRGRVAAFSSLEMGRDELTVRWIAQAGRVTLTDLDRRKLNQTQAAAVGDVAKVLSSLPIAVDDRGSQTVWDVRHHARSAGRRGALGIVVVDYLQLMTPPPDLRRANRQEQVAHMSRSLKILAKELGVPVVALSQLNRQLEGRTDKTPQMSDLRESGAVEQDADVVILMHRDLDNAPDELHLFVPKNRHGQTGKVSLDWQGHYARALSRSWSPSAVAS